MGSRRIVIVHHDKAEREHLLAALASAGFEATGTDSPAHVSPDRLADVGAVVLSETAFEGDDAGPYLDQLNERETLTPCLVLPLSATVERTATLMRRGAFSVLSSPVESDQLVLQIEQALRHLELRRKNARLQESLELSERLAMIGKLAAGVAHELNNPLDGVLRYVNLAVDSLPKDAQQIPYLMESRRGLRRMADIVRELLQFSRNAAIEQADEDARSLARDAVTQVVQLAPHKKIVTDVTFPPGNMRLPRAMFQVFGNLAKNAVDAMPAGGRLELTAQYEGDVIVLEFSDDGVGIPEEIRSRIFEPFFTTKEVGQGTGLGLPICQRILERLGGTLELTSEMGHGTKVRMTLPAETARGAAREAAQSPTARRITALAQRTGDR